jgi:hypothetical protein
MSKNKMEWHNAQQADACGCSNSPADDRPNEAGDKIGKGFGGCAREQMAYAKKSENSAEKTHTINKQHGFYPSV